MLSSRGSVLVDYFVFLNNVDRELSTTDVRRFFHQALLDSDPREVLPFASDDAYINAEVPVDGRVRFGRYTIDTRYTDFKG